MYAELHCKTNFSFLEGAAHPEELVERAAELQYAALAITDRHSLAGVVRAHTRAKDLGLKLLVGAEIVPRDAPPLVLLATDRAAYGRLARLLTCGRRRGSKGECRLTFDDVAGHAEGLLAAVTSAERLRRPEDRNTADARCSDADQSDALEAGLPDTAGLHAWREVFGDRCYLLAELHYGVDDRRRLNALRRLAARTGVPLAAAGDVHYHVAQRMPLHHVLTAVRYRQTVDQVRRWLFPNSLRHLRSPDELAALFAELPAAIEHTLEAAARCAFSLDQLRYEYPEELAPRGRTLSQHLGKLTWQGARRRYPSGVPRRVRQQIEHELALIAELRYEAYFLTVWDLVRFARSREILCQGRGSAANSAVCFCLGITSVDPDQMDVLFERFVSRERNEAPDIDVDFEHERREEVLQYIYQKYGRERAGMTAEVITYRSRSAVRDVGKALGLSLDRVDRLAKNLEGRAVDEHLQRRCRMSGLDPDSRLGRQLLMLVEQLIGFPRHLSQHVGGMVITQGPLCELCPIENAAMADRTVIQWNKDDLDELGILKVDCLALGMLTAIRKCFDLLQRHTGDRLTLASIPPGDRQVYQMICRADTMGVFQIESRAQMSMLPRLRPRCFYDLVIEVAIVRPGPIQGNMVHPYLRRRAGEEQVTYPNEAIREVLHKTLGVPLFQEQAMRLAVVAAGFTPGEADQLRRAMGAWRRPGIIDQFRRKLIEGMLQRGLSPEFAEHVFTQIRGFGEYGFPESHATSFALLVYVSAWLKCHFPAAFTAALLNSQPMGFYAPAQLVREVRDHRVAVRPIDVNASDWDCTLEPTGGAPPDHAACSQLLAAAAAPEANSAERAAPRTFAAGRVDPPAAAEKDLADDAENPPGAVSAERWALRLGLRLIAGFPFAAAKRLVEARRSGPFRDWGDLARRTGFSQAVLAQLAEADACRSLAVDRRQALWQALAPPSDRETCPLLANLAETEPLPDLPALCAKDQVYADYRTTGLTLRQHPISFYRRDLDRMQVAAAEKLADWPNGKPVSVAGLVLVRQRPSTAKGITFVTLEDETGTANLVVRQRVWQRYYQVARTAAAMIATGILERKDAVIHLVVYRLQDLTDQLHAIGSQSRDFH